MSPEVRLKFSTAILVLLLLGPLVVDDLCRVLEIFEFSNSADSFEVMLNPECTECL